MSPIDQFFHSWGLTDSDERLSLLREAVAANGTYADPMTPEPIVGPDAAADYVAAFATNAPGATASVVARQDRHGVARATVEFRMADGQVQHGQYFVEFDDEGRIARMVGFVGVGEPEV